MSDSPFELPSAVLLADTDAAVEADRIRAGELWHDAPVAGLQFYAYGERGLNGEPIRPRLGQRLGLVRAPDNAFDGYAVEVWLGNGVMLGHLPADVAGWVAGPLDAGRPLRAYCAHPGDGTAWSMRILLVGEALAEQDEPPPAEPCRLHAVAGAEDDDIPF
ncbi:HIRAN domain-containing protein [Methylobacterium indicum]|uniref:HIRAN domain-containing protein n=1 Tax=Methylobacterium indicum TaxID=1775910 RepID=UPI002435C4ED|nr:HIRAN domain-containing protein [Methylobacterium indicum]